MWCSTAPSDRVIDVWVSVRGREHCGASTPWSRTPRRCGRAPRYVDAGCDVLRPKLGAADRGAPAGRSAVQGWPPVIGMDVARRRCAWPKRRPRRAGAVTSARWLQRQPEMSTPRRKETVRLLARVFGTIRPTCPDGDAVAGARLHYATVERLLESGIPLWLSFRALSSRGVRRLRRALGRSEGDAFGRDVRRSRRWACQRC